MIRLPFVLFLICNFFISIAVAEESIIAGRFGRIRGIVDSGEQYTIDAKLRVPTRGWGRSFGLTDARRIDHSLRGDTRTVQGAMPIGEGKLEFQQTITSVASGAEVGITCRARSALDIEGVYYWTSVPIADFAAGRVEVFDDDELVATVDLPTEKPEKRHLFIRRGTRVRMTDVSGKRIYTLSLDRPMMIGAQDTRDWNGTSYDVYVALHSGALEANESVQAKIELKMTGTPDRTPAKITIDRTVRRYKLDGFGGNYCFRIEEPQTQYTLDRLRVAWARTEMTPYEWEPENDNDDPSVTDWATLEARDREGSNLRREFLLAQQLERRGIPYCISIWSLPEWMYEKPGLGRQAHRRRIAADRWPEVLESIGSYLLYAKRKYGVTPDLFSFNEANIGVKVFFSAEEHRDAIKRLGRHFESLGLTTKMLLADATGPRGTEVYATPTVEDPEALKYCGAVGFHSWGGASAEQYAAWGDLAERLKLPLLVTELGVDAAAWRDQSYDSFAYAMRELQMYQEILQYARPQGTMHWEYTSDYSIVHLTKDSDGQSHIEPTARFDFIRQFSNLTPAGAWAIRAESDNTRVLATAFVGSEDDSNILTIHVANLGSSREVTLTGLPSKPTNLNLIQTTEQTGYQKLPPAESRDGALKLNLPARSMTTIVTSAVLNQNEK